MNVPNNVTTQFFISYIYARYVIFSQSYGDNNLKIRNVTKPRYLSFLLTSTKVHVLKKIKVSKNDFIYPTNRP